MKHYLSILLIAGSISLCARASVPVGAGYTGYTTTNPDNVSHLYGPYFVNRSSSSVYITAVHVTAYPYGPLGWSTVNVVPCKYNNPSEELEYEAGYIEEGNTYPFISFGPNYVELLPGESLGLYVHNHEGDPVRAFYAFWLSYSRP